MNALGFQAPIRQLDLGFARRGARTVLHRRVFSWPFVLTRTFRIDPLLPHLQTVIVQTSSGAIHADDRLDQQLDVGEGAAVHLTSQGAASVHRARPGEITRERVQLRIANGGWLEYLPQPRILFPNAALEQSIDVDCSSGATALIGDAFTLHDPEGSGRLFTRYGSTLRVYRAAEMQMFDRFDIHGDDRLFARHRAFGTLLALADWPELRLEALALDLSGQLEMVPGLYAAASVLPAGIGIGLRFAAGELRQLRSGTDIAVSALRQALVSGSDQAMAFI